MPRTLLLSIAMIVAPFAHAVAPELAEKTELRLFGGFDLSGPNGDNLDLQAGYGRYLGDDLLIGGEYRFRLIEDIAPGEHDYRTQQFSFVVEKLFPGETPLVPFVGAEIGLRSIRFDSATPASRVDDSGLVAGGRAGLRYFLSESVSIHGSLQWLLAGDDLFVIDFEPDDQYIYPVIGISAVF